MEVKIGVVDSPRELTLSSGQAHEEVESLVAEALKSADGVLKLSDTKGRQYIVPAAKIAYVELGPADAPRVGFGVG